jgi:putative transposase
MAIGNFGVKGYYVDTVGRNKKIIEEYIKNQIQEDITYEQMSLKEYIDPFTGEPVNKGKK